MPIFRGSGGEIPRRSDEEPTTRRINRDDNSSPSEETIVAGNEPNTTIIGGWKKEPISPQPKSEDITDPVVGWIVIAKGYGRGRSLSLGYGMNGIGRGKTERICLDFGDETISKSTHAVVTYDPRGRKFYLQHGGGKNLTYLNDEPVLVPTQLLGNEEILLGETILRFVPLCGETFDWQDETE